MSYILYVLGMSWQQLIAFVEEFYWTATTRLNFPALPGYFIWTMSGSDKVVESRSPFPRSLKSKTEIIIRRRICNHLRFAGLSSTTNTCSRKVAVISSARPTLTTRMLLYLSLTFPKASPGLILKAQNPHCIQKFTYWKSNLHKIHNSKISFFTKLTFLKSHFSQNSHSWNLIFHKICIFEIKGISG